METKRASQSRKYSQNVFFYSMTAESRAADPAWPLPGFGTEPREKSESHCREKPEPDPTLE